MKINDSLSLYFKVNSKRHSYLVKMKILIIKFRNIGDVLLMTPLVSNLKVYYKDAQIDVAVNHHTDPMINLKS